MIDPATMPFARFSADLARRLETAGAPSPRPPLNEKDWKSWAVAIIGLPQVSRYNPPSPLGFDDWRVWGARFASTYDLQGL